ncbi:hypothetical protein BDQ12DRAFT_731372 [Crucibulum laeve]|uniref:C2 domain-containing protein n=1 Tax=Crucibulum laeve TaxID=68775 RepID=A0A5C3MDQ5_9AGAR|nr:hypothetical protein BDQ12DRAFT_731372 [Crucibulum laeve]
MSATPREIGTLIVVILRAAHLPNKRHIGKQDPYCLISFNGEKRRTKAIKRGGQHPEWDEELRFTLYEDVEDTLRRTANGDGTPPPPPPKDNKAPKKIKGGTKMKIACYADDPREPDLVGEADVDLTEVLTKGETDEWFSLTNKDKFAGKVYLELTFWSNEPPPEKKATPKPPKANKQYAGPGSFVSAGELPAGSPSRMSPAGTPYDHSRKGSDIAVPSSLRASNSLAKLDLYVPPYEQKSYLSPMDKIAHEFDEFGISDPHRRRGSFPPLHNGLSYRPPSSVGFSTISHQSGHSYDSSVQEGGSIYSYDGSITPSQSTLQHPSSLYTGHAPYQSQYEGISPPTPQPPTRGPRHSTPMSSSGFMPLSSHSSFPMPTHHPDASAYAPPLSHTPSSGYNQPQYSHHTSYGSPTSQTPVPPSSTPFQQQQSFNSSQSFGYYPPPQPSTSAPPQQYVVSQAPTPIPQTHSAPPQVYQGYATTPSPSHDNISASTLPPNMPTGSTVGLSSRPLPQEPQIVYTQTVQGSHPPPQPGSSQQQTANYPALHVGSVAFPTNNGYPSIPPPPPPPPPSQVQYNSEQHYPAPGAQTHVVPPPPPPPLHTIVPGGSRRHVSLPQPPSTFTHPLPPPPPPPADYSTQQQQLSPPPPPLPPIPVGQNQPYHSNPLPPPPPHHGLEHQQWIPMQNTHNIQNGYTAQGYT